MTPPDSYRTANAPKVKFSEEITGIYRDGGGGSRKKGKKK
jgi:hypothetical protein